MSIDIYPRGLREPYGLRVSAGQDPTRNHTHPTAHYPTLWGVSLETPKRAWGRVAATKPSTAADRKAIL
jgi:hypothetical protein